MIPKNITCLPHTSGLSDEISANLTIYAPRSTPIRAQATRCILRKRKVCTFTGFFGSRGIIADLSEEEHIEPYVCKNALTTKMFKKQTLVEKQANVWNTDNRLSQL